MKAGTLGVGTGTSAGTGLHSLTLAATGGRNVNDGSGSGLGGRGGKNLRIGTQQQCSEEALTDQTIMGSNYNYSQSAALPGSQKTKHTSQHQGKKSVNTFAASVGSQSRDHSLGGGTQGPKTKNSKDWTQSDE